VSPWFVPVSLAWASWSRLGENNRSRHYFPATVAFSQPIQQHMAIQTFTTTYKLYNHQVTSKQTKNRLKLITLASLTWKAANIGFNS